jgi:hypothetical protein
MTERLTALDHSGKSDLEVIDLDDALFLFGLRLIQGCTNESELKAVWFRYASHWHRVSLPEVFFYLREACIERAIQFGGELSVIPLKQASLYPPEGEAHQGAVNA